MLYLPGCQNPAALCYLFEDLLCVGVFILLLTFTHNIDMWLQASQLPKVNLPWHFTVSVNTDRGEE